MAKERAQSLECQLAIRHEGIFIQVSPYGTKRELTRKCDREFADRNRSCVYTCFHYIGLKEKHPDNHSKPIDVTERCPRPRGIRLLSNSRV